MSSELDDRRRRGVGETLAAVVAGDEPIDVPLAALWVSAAENPGLDVAAARRELAEVAERAARRAAAVDNPFERFDAVRTYLFEHRGFRGNVDDYDDPANSYLDRVLATGLGIPITLSLIAVEALRAAGFEARGVALPGHFVVRFARGGRVLWCDPYHGGAIVTEEDCRDLVSRSTGRPTLFRRDDLHGTTGRATLVRLLRNLKRIWLAREDYARALGVVDLLRAVQPDDARELRDRGILLAHVGRPAAAVADLESYLDRVPGAADGESVRGRLAWLRRRMAESN